MTADPGTIDPLPGSDEETSPDVLVVPAGVRRDADEGEGSLGFPGRPFDRRSPFFIGLTGALGVAVAYVAVRSLADLGDILVVIGLALFIAIGLNPIVEFLVGHRLSRGVAVGVVTCAFVLVVGAFVVTAVPPISHEAHSLATNYPRYKADVVDGKGWAGKLAARLHLTSYLKGRSKLKLPITGGLLGAGKLLLSLGVGSISVIALTIYFLIALPGVRRLWLALIPRSRRERVGLLTDEVFDRVGGFMLGNLLSSLIAGVGTYVWLLVFGVPYALLLAIFVALFDLIPIVGSTIAGVVVSLVALSRGLPIAAATAGFYVAYRFLEDYLVNPRVMKHTVKVTPGLTIIATLIGGALLGLVGALIAIPVGATVHLLMEEVTIPRQDLR